LGNEELWTVKGKTLIVILIAAALGSAVWSSWAKTSTYQNTVLPACDPKSFEVADYTICTYDPERHDFRLTNLKRDGKALRNFAELSRYLGKSSKRVVFAMNAGMYDEQGKPIGLYVENGKQRAPLNRRDAEGNFYLKPNGVFWMDAAGPYIDTTDAFALKSDAIPIWATQSGPMLVIDGIVNSRFSHDGTSRHIRNGVCVTRSNRAIFVISSTEISLGKFARFLRDDLKCANALYLDGEVSSLWDGATGRNDQKYPLGPMLVVSKRQGR
jgi:uncharacterized protein YigE (DUF2233 family)